MKNNIEINLTKKEINLTKKEIALYCAIQRIGSGEPIKVEQIRRATKIRGKSLSGVMSSLRKKNLISTNGSDIFY